MRIWNSQGQTITLYKEQHGDIYLNDLAWSTDNQNILSGSDDGTIDIWNAHTQEIHVHLTPGIQGIDGLSWLHNRGSDNTLLAAGNDNGSVTIRDLTTKTITNVYTGHTKPITVVAFSPDGKHIAS